MALVADTVLDSLRKQGPSRCSQRWVSVLAPRQVVSGGCSCGGKVPLLVHERSFERQHYFRRKLFVLKGWPRGLPKALIWI